MSEKKTPDLMDPEFWRTLPMDNLKELLNRGLLVPVTGEPGSYYLVTKVVLPNKPEEVLAS